MSNEWKTSVTEPNPRSLYPKNQLFCEAQNPFEGAVSKSFLQIFILLCRENLQIYKGILSTIK
jgi:hypothetical protein